MSTTQQPEALRLANEFKLCNEYDSIPSMNDIAKAEAELRRQHARIAELEADHFPGVTKMTARWYMVDKDGMATLCTDKADAEKEAADAQSVWPHTAPHRAVQLVEVDSIAASAGSEPVAWFTEEHSDVQDLEWNRLKPTYPGNWKPLYLHPSPPGGMVAEQALRKVLSVVQRYLPPDGPTANDAMTEITEIVDPWPLGPLEKP